jgi:hypothetical protein
MAFDLYHMGIRDLNHALHGFQPDFSSMLNGLAQFASAMHGQLDHV